MIVRVAAALAGAVAVAAASSVIWFFATGGTVTTMATPSMSPALPVGSLVIARPLRETAQVGQVIVFRPPGDAHTYVHRVAAVLHRPGGGVAGYRTEGDEVGRPDPWLVAPGDVRGAVVGVVPGAGWLPAIAPVVAACVVAAALLGAAAPRWRRWIALDVGCAGLWVASASVHPFVRWAAVTVTHEGEVLRARVADTGLLPLTLRAHPGGTLRLAAGHLGIITAPASRAVVVAATARLAPAVLAALLLACAVPAAAAAAAAVAARPGARPAGGVAGP